MDQQPKWRFARMTPSEINQDPVQGEFFSAASDLPERLVREAIQNSLDAGRDGEQVCVRFAFSGARHALPVADARTYLAGLEPHIKALAPETGTHPPNSSNSGAELSATEDARVALTEPMTYLVIGDFGTKGLTGSIERDGNKEQGNDFWGFFRSIGISPKGEDAGGSWGLGKWVFPDASRINAYLAATQRIDEERCLLMGMAMLKTHSIGEEKYRPYGYFAAPAPDKEDHEWQALPVDSDEDPAEFVLETLVRFGMDYRLRERDATGLSIVVPYPKAELEPAAIARAVITQWFLPIMRGDLVVEIDHPDADARLIDVETIAAEVAGIAESEARDDESPESLLGVIELAQWAIERGDGASLELPARNLAEAMEQLDLDALRERYSRGERLAFRLTRDVRVRATDETETSSFRVYLERADDLREGHDYFVRGNLRIPHMDHLRRRKARALVLVDGGSVLGHMLRDAEGPAHASWDPRAQRLKDNWVGGYQRVQDVRRAAAQLLGRLVERPDERQMDALADLFPGDPSQIGRKRSRTGGGGTTPSRPEPPVLKPSVLEVAKPAGGFVVQPAPAHECKTPLVGTTWDLRFAYDTVRGNPFSVFDRGVKQECPDFSLLEDEGGLDLELDGCEIVGRDHNAFRVVVLDEQFRIAVRGFDERDLKVQVDEVREAEVAGDEREEDVA